MRSGITDKEAKKVYCSECGGVHKRLPLGLGVPIGVNDRTGRPIRIGSVLRFDEKEWGAPMTFRVKLKDGEIVHPGTTSDLTEWCTIVDHCCVVECDKPAEFEIHGGSGHFEDSTQACREHVGELLSTPEWLDQDNKHWTVFVLEGGGEK